MENNTIACNQAGFTIVQPNGKIKPSQSSVVAQFELLPRAPDFARYPCDGSRDRNPRLEHRGTRRTIGE